MNKKVLLTIGILLCLFGLLKPNLKNILKPNNTPNSITNIEQPNNDLLESAQKVVEVLKKDNASTSDCVRLSNLYYDMAQLILLDGDKQLVSSTEEIRQANRISGLMLKMNLNDKYPDLASSMNSVVVASIGDDNVPLSTELRQKAVNAFLALAWACNEGSK